MEVGLDLPPEAPPSDVPEEEDAAPADNELSGPLLPTSSGVAPEPAPEPPVEIVAPV
jgi:hypothetical protein